MAEGGGLAGMLFGAGAGGVVGGAVVRLVMDPKEFNAALGAAETKNAAAGEAMGGTWSKFKTVAVAGFAAAGVAAISFATSSIKAAIEANDAQLKLANAIANSKLNAQQAIPAFQDQAQALRDLTGVDDDLINASQSILVNMGLTQDQITELTPLVVDLSQKYGVGLDTAMKAVGKAAEGSTGGLARMVGPIEKGSTAAETYQNVLKKLSAVQGFAAEQAQAEPWRLLQMQWQELQEQVGRELLPSLQQLASDLVPIAETILPALAHSFDIVAAAIQGADQVLALLDGHLPNFQNNALSAAKILSFFGGVNNAAADAADQYRAAIDRATAAAAHNTSQVAEQTKTVEEHVQAMQDERNAALESAGGLVGLSASLQQLAEDQKELNQLRAKGKTDTLAYRDAERQFFNDKVSLIQALQQEKDALSGTTNGYSQVVGMLQAWGKQAGITKGQLTALLTGVREQLDAIPNYKKVTVDVDVNVSGGLKGHSLVI